MVHDQADMAASFDNWHLLQGHHHGRPMLVRYNAGAEPLAGRGTHDIRVGVAVPFNVPDPDGLPELVEGETLELFEDELVELVAGRATLVAVITADGMREFVLYTSDGRWLGSFRRALEQAIPTHHVQVDAKPDPQWDLYRSFAPWPQPAVRAVR